MIRVPVPARAAARAGLVIARSLPVTAMEPVGDGWTISGRAVPYCRPTRVTDNGTDHYMEEFSPGCFAQDANSATRGGWVRLFVGHGSDDYGSRYLGRCKELDERPDGLYATFRLERQHPLAEAARSGDLTGWSVSARIKVSKIERRPTGPVVVRRAATLDHVAATALPQYADTGVLAVRERPRRTPRLDALRTAGFGSRP